MFFGIGSYTSALLFTKMGISPWLGLIAGGIVAAFFSQIIGYPLFRLAGHYFAIATIVVAEIVQTVLINWDYCGGARGLWIPILDEGIGNLQFHSSKTPYYFIGCGLCCFIFFLTFRIQQSKLGYYFRAIKNEPVTARSRGINTSLHKSVALLISAFFMGMVGAFYSQYILFIDPRSVLPTGLSVTIALIPILGGIGTLWGPLIGAAILIPLSELSRAYLGGGEKAIDLIVYGVLIMGISLYEPRGIMGFFKRGREQ